VAEFAPMETYFEVMDVKEIADSLAAPALSLAT
jgi:hypothetical protein